MARCAFCCQKPNANISSRFSKTLISELDHAVAAAEREAREREDKHADLLDQAASEYERQALVHKAATARQTLKNLTQALERMRQGLSASAPNAAAT